MAAAAAAPQVAEPTYECSGGTTDVDALTNLAGGISATQGGDFTKNSGQTECGWRITLGEDSPATGSVELRFTEFNLPEAGAGGCGTNFVRIYEGCNAVAENKVGDYCGLTLPPTVVTSKKCIFVMFRTSE